MNSKKVFIAHQNTIPHYRVSFYEAVNKLKPNWWDFTVVYDLIESENLNFVPIDLSKIGFKVIMKKSYLVNIKGARVIYQPFFLDALKSDLIILEHAINNLTYPFSIFAKVIGRKVAYWGTGKDFKFTNPTGFKKVTEKIKVWLAKNADGFFAYTGSVKNFLINNGCKPEDIFTLYNTIDINHYRSSYLKLSEDITAIKKEWGIDNKKVVLYAGRFNQQKRVNFLKDTIDKLYNLDPLLHIMMVGGGGHDFTHELISKYGNDFISYHGLVPEEKISQIFTAGDVYIFPGAVGLGPVQALCHDLTPIIIDSPYHNAEFDYLNENNSIILMEDTSASQYADKIIEFLNDDKKRNEYKKNAWPSIKELTIENMARNFVNGVNSLLSDKEYHNQN